MGKMVGFAEFVQVGGGEVLVTLSGDFPKERLAYMMLVESLRIMGMSGGWVPVQGAAKVASALTAGKAKGVVRKRGKR